MRDDEDTVSQNTCENLCSHLQLDIVIVGFEYPPATIRNHLEEILREGLSTLGWSVGISMSDYTD